MNDLFCQFLYDHGLCFDHAPHPPTPPPARSGEIVSSRTAVLASVNVAAVLLHPCTVSCWHFTSPEWKCLFDSPHTDNTVLCARVNISTSSSLHGAQRLKITSQMFEVQHCATLCCPSWFSSFTFMTSNPFVVLRRLRAILYLVCSGTLLSAVLLCCCFNRGFSNKKQIPPCFFFSCLNCALKF